MCPLWDLWNKEIPSFEFQLGISKGPNCIIHGSLVADAYGSNSPPCLELICSRTNLLYCEVSHCALHLMCWHCNSSKTNVKANVAFNEDKKRDHCLEICSPRTTRSEAYMILRFTSHSYWTHNQIPSQLAADKELFLKRWLINPGHQRFLGGWSCEGKIDQ